MYSHLSSHAILPFRFVKTKSKDYKGNINAFCVKTRQILQY